jgi:cysteine sulfinate desulfinase/cysteine desulfurase-like protein
MQYSQQCRNNCRRTVASSLNTTPRRIVFTSSGTEANNMAFKGAAALSNDRKTIITSSIEHPAVIEPLISGGGHEMGLRSSTENTLNITIPGFRGESIVLHMDRLGVSFSSGSTCKSESSEPSHALLAIEINAYAYGDDTEYNRFATLYLIFLT